MNRHKTAYRDANVSFFVDSVKSLAFFTEIV